MSATPKESPKPNPPTPPIADPVVTPGKPESPPSPIKGSEPAPPQQQAQGAGTRGTGHFDNAHLLRDEPVRPGQY